MNPQLVLLALSASLFQNLGVQTEPCHHIDHDPRIMESFLQLLAELSNHPQELTTHLASDPEQSLTLMEEKRLLKVRKISYLR
jgi:hypothetical protein